MEAYIDPLISLWSVFPLTPISLPQILTLENNGVPKTKTLFIDKNTKKDQEAFPAIYTFTPWLEWSIKPQPEAQVR